MRALRSVLFLVVVGCGSSNAAGDPSTDGTDVAEAGAGGAAGVAPSGSGGKPQAGSGGAKAGTGGSAGGAAAGGAQGTGGAQTGAGGAPGTGGTSVAGSEIAVYTDAKSLTSIGWKVNGTFKEISTACQEGTKCYQYDYQVKGYYDGFTLNLSKPIDASQATGLRYAYKGMASAPQGTFFFVRLHSGAKACAAGCDIENHDAAADWQVVTIPSASLKNGNEIDLNNITAIEIGFSGPDASGSVSFDDIVFTL
jgi:hypothetical protein